MQNWYTIKHPEKHLSQKQKMLHEMTESALAYRWRESSATPDPLDSPDDPGRMAVLRAKAITAALMYDDDSNVGSESTRTGFVPKVQDHIEAAGEFGIAQDIDDAVELGESIRKVLFCAGVVTLLMCCSLAIDCTMQSLQVQIRLGIADVDELSAAPLQTHLTHVLFQLHPTATFTSFLLQLHHL